MELVLATRNPHKVREFSGLLAPHTVLPLPSSVELPPETGSTFEENALIKARAAHEATGMPAFADDSGIAVVALDGRPGIYSARYAGEGASDEENLAKLVDETAGLDDRRAYYVCAIAYVDEGSEQVIEERCYGRLAHTPTGDGGFGYDPIFIPDGLSGGRTMAQLGQAEKDAVSHRGKAGQALRKHLLSQYS